MAISLIQIKRWYNMLAGKSVEHVSQDIGKHFVVGQISGYYNNLTQKVTMMPELVDTEELPLIKQLDGKYIIFPVAVFQFTLGCYDLYLSTTDRRYYKKFIQCADWTLAKQDTHGRWDNFSHTYPDSPYGAMAQGEATSILIRAYNQTQDKKYIEAAKKSIDFMLKPINHGGTSIYEGDDLLFAEYTNLPVVLNGWIFAWWGLYDYVVVTGDKGYYKDKLDQSCRSIIKYLPSFKNAYWSKYDLGNNITSPFYHNLHVAQMQAMYKLTGEKVFDEYAKKWESQLRNPINKSIAFTVKAIQKILEK